MLDSTHVLLLLMSVPSTALSLSPVWWTSDYRVSGYMVSLLLIMSSSPHHTVPCPTVDITLSSADSTVSANSSTSQSYLAGSTLTITCDIDVPLSINTMMNVIMGWTGDGSDIENSPRVSYYYHGN